MRRRRSLTARRVSYLLLLVPFVGLLWVPFYARTEPELFGFPFFYWYQFAWVFVAVILTAIVYRIADPGAGEDSPSEERDDGSGPPGRDGPSPPASGGGGSDPEAPDREQRRS